MRACRTPGHTHMVVSGRIGSQTLSWPKDALLAAYLRQLTRTERRNPQSLARSSPMRRRPTIYFSFSGASGALQPPPSDCSALVTHPEFSCDQSAPSVHHAFALMTHRIPSSYWSSGISSRIKRAMEESVIFLKMSPSLNSSPGAYSTNAGTSCSPRALVLPSVATACVPAPTVFCP